MLGWVILIAQLAAVDEQYDRGAEISKTIVSMHDSNTAFTATCTADVHALSALRDIERELAGNATEMVVVSARDTIRKLLESGAPASDEMTATLHTAETVLNGPRPGLREAFHHQVVDPAADRVRRNAADLLSRLRIMRTLNQLTGSAVQQLENGLLEAAKEGV
jgi:hypothetical protein